MHGRFEVHEEEEDAPASIHFHWAPTREEWDCSYSMFPDDYSAEHSELDLMIVDLAKCPDVTLWTGRELMGKPAKTVLFHATPARVAFISQGKAVYISAEEPGQQEVINFVTDRNRGLGIDIPSDMRQRWDEEAESARRQLLNIQATDQFNRSKKLAPCVGLDPKNESHMSLLRKRLCEFKDMKEKQGKPLERSDRQYDLSKGETNEFIKFYASIPRRNRRR